MVSEETTAALREAYMPEMPHVEGGMYLIGYLLDIGPTLAAGVGVGPLTCAEIESWCRRTEIDLHPWQDSFLRRLSGEYIAQSHKAGKRDCPPPWEGAASIARAITGSGMKDALKALADL